MFIVEPALVSIYSQADLAKYLSLHPSRVWRWLRSDAAWLEHSLDSKDFSFAHLVEMRVVTQMLDLGIPLRKVQRAYKELREEFGHFPLAQVRLMEFSRTPVRIDTWEALASGRQLLIDEVVRTIGQEIHYSDDGLADEWRPSDRVYLNPTRQFGTPSVARGIPTRVLYRAFLAEDEDAQRIAWWYEVPIEDVKAAITFERGLKSSPRHLHHAA